MLAEDGIQNYEVSETLKVEGHPQQNKIKQNRNVRSKHAFFPQYKTEMFWKVKN